MGDIAMCLATLSYLFQHIWTNLLTQCPSASLCLMLSVHCRKRSIIKVLGKFQKNYNKKQQIRRLQKAGGGPEGSPPCLGGLLMRPRVGSRLLAAWSGAPPLAY